MRGRSAALQADVASMADQFPMFRLATLLARQLSSPIATRIKEYAKSHPHFGRSVCMRGGRVAAAAELRFKMWSLQLRAKPAQLAALSDARALEAGADLLGEMILFALGACIITFEYNRQAMKQEEKVMAERSAWIAVLLQAEELQRELQAQQKDIDRLSAVLRDLAQRAASPSIPRSPLVPQPPPVSGPPPVLQPPPMLGPLFTPGPAPMPSPPLMPDRPLVPGPPLVLQRPPMPGPSFAPEPAPIPRPPLVPGPPPMPSPPLGPLPEPDASNLCPCPCPEPSTDPPL